MPGLEESVVRASSLSSLATVHKHLTNLQDKGFIKRTWTRSRSVELVPSASRAHAIELPLLGYVAAGPPIEAVVAAGRSPCPKIWSAELTYVLRVKGD